MSLQHQSRIVRFLVSGGVAAAFNLLIIWLLIEKLGMQNPALRNVANAIAIEISTIFCFYVYRIFVWPE